MKLIDIDAIRREVRDDWFNQTLCEVNDCVVRIGVVKGKFHWHKHDREDEFFFVVDGRLYIDTENETFELRPHQGFTVPKGVLHRTRAPERTAMLMIEGLPLRRRATRRAGFTPTIDSSALVADRRM